MAPNECYTPLIHAMIRAMLQEEEFSSAYRKLGIQLFPLYESAARRKTTPPSYKELYEIGRAFISMDEEDQLVATCVSVAVTMQALLFCNGVDAELLIGLKKIDEKLFAHAWVRMPDGQMLDPQEKYGDLHITKVLRLKEQAERWALSIP